MNILDSAHDACARMARQAWEAGAFPLRIQYDDGHAVEISLPGRRRFIAQSRYWTPGRAQGYFEFWINEGGEPLGSKIQYLTPGEVERCLAVALEGGDAFAKGLEIQRSEEYFLRGIDY